MIKKYNELTSNEKELFDLVIDISPEYLIKETVQEYILIDKGITIWYTINYFSYKHDQKVQGKHFDIKYLKKELRERKLNALLSIK